MVFINIITYLLYNYTILHKSYQFLNQYHLPTFLILKYLLKPQIIVFNKTLDNIFFFM